MLPNERLSTIEPTDCIVIIDDESVSPSQITKLLNANQTVFFVSFKEACELLPQLKTGTILVGHGSLSHLYAIHSLAKKIKIIAMPLSLSQFDTTKILYQGIFDLVPVNDIQNMLLPAIKRAQYVNQLEQELERVNRYQLANSLLLSKDTNMQSIIDRVTKIADSDTSVVLIGESGTGKALIAKELHNKSRRADNAFVRINCDIASNSLEKELFGLLDDQVVTRGKIEFASAGTLFLDGIDKLTMDLQTKIISFINAKKSQIRTRIISSSHLDTMQLAKDDSEFSKIYSPFCEIAIRLPPLRERKEDIWLLANKFLQQFNKIYHRDLRGFSDEVQKVLVSYPWPGNVRELENVIKSSVIMTQSSLIHASDLMIKKDNKNEAHKILNLKQIREKTERQVIAQALSRVKGNVSKAANLLGISRPTLYTLINKYSLN